MEVVRDTSRLYKIILRERKISEAQNRQETTHGCHLRNSFRLKGFFGTFSFSKVVKFCTNNSQSINTSSNIKHCHNKQKLESCSTSGSLDSAYFSHSWDTKGGEIPNKISDISTSGSRPSSLLSSTKQYCSDNSSTNITKLSSTAQNISSQVKIMKYRIKCQLVELFPSLTTTITTYFLKTPDISFSP